jgi:tetratricopeptide (TPR) repeat protein
MSKKPFGASMIYVYLGLVFIALIGIRTISTPEIWTHLAQGASNAPISYLESNSAINPTHLYDKLIYGLWNMGGAPTLILFNVICLLAAFVLLLKVSSKWGGPLSQGFALLVSGHLIFQGLDVGPKTIMMLFIALFVYLVTTLKKPALLFGILIPLQILWANMHGSFLFGPFIIALAAIQAGQASKVGKRKKLNGPSVGLLGGLAGACLVSTLANPYLAGLYGQIIANIKMPYPAYWVSLFREYFQIQTTDPLIFFVLILGAGGLITLKKRLPIILTTLAIIGAFLVFRSTYAAQLFVALAFPFIVLSFSAIGEYLSGSLKTFLGKQEKILEPVAQGIFALLIVLSLIPVVGNCAYAHIGSASNFGLGIQDELYPSDAEAILGDPAFPEKSINLAADGGYLAFNYPERKIFIDYRSGRYDRELLENLSSMMLGNSKAYDTLLDAYRPEAIILNTLDQSAAQGLVSLLSRRIWKLAYFDGTTAILLLNKKELAPLINNKEAQAAGLAKLEEAKTKYAAKVGKGCHAGNPAQLIGAGKIFLALNRPEPAEEIFSLLLKGNDKIPGAWIGLGNSQLMLKKFEIAMESLKTATGLSPNNLKAWLSYANACKFAGNTDGYMQAIQKAKQLIEENRTKAPEEEVIQPEATKEETQPESLLDLTVPE